MANPNIVNITSLYGNITYLTPSVTTSVVLLTNATGSNSVMKINKITATNTDTASVNASVGIYSNGSIAQGSAPSGGTQYLIASTLPITTSSTLSIIGKDSSFYLTEGNCIVITSSTSNKLDFVISYELIS